jgi:hypothetical protein
MALADTIDKLVDADSGFSVPGVITAGHMLPDHGVGRYKEPLPDKYISCITH